MAWRRVPCVSPLLRCLFARTFAHSVTELFPCLTSERPLYVLDLSLLSASQADMSCLSGASLHPVRSFFHRTTVFDLDEVQGVRCSLGGTRLWSCIQHPRRSSVSRSSPVLASRSPTVSYFPFRSVMRFELIFVTGGRSCLGPLFFHMWTPSSVCICVPSSFLRCQ